MMPMMPYPSPVRDFDYKNQMGENKRETEARMLVIRSTRDLLQAILPGHHELIERAADAWQEYFIWQMEQANKHLMEGLESKEKYAYKPSVDDLTKMVERRDQLKEQVESVLDALDGNPMKGLLETTVVEPVRQQIQQLEAQISHVQGLLEKQ